MSLRFAFLTVAAVLALAVFPTVAAGDPPVSFPFQDSFVDVNPCTGLDHTVTVAGTFYVYERGVHGLSHRLPHTTTTSDGYNGGGIEVSVDHDSVFVIRDVLTNEEGQKMFAQLVVVQDADGTPRVERFELRCGP
jgi:hypothetical protein